MDKKDKLIERDRYNLKAKLFKIKDKALFGCQSMPLYLAEPYLFYESSIKKLITDGMRVLELGSGLGEHTKVLLDTSAEITALDISINSLKLLKTNFSNYSNLKICEADMENLPFEDNTFDAVCCSGSLSYGSPDLVDKEISRVLCDGGILICVDSLNHNLLYRFNRFIHFLRGNRSKATLTQMPTIARIESMIKSFSYWEVRYYGAITYLMPLLSKIIGTEQASKLSSRIDKILVVKNSAFKFVLIATNLQK